MGQLKWEMVLSRLILSNIFLDVKCPIGQALLMEDRAMSEFCEFCIEFAAAGTSSRSRIIWEDNELLLLPTIGCLRPGYCLLMPRIHRRSFAALDEDELSETENSLRCLRGRIAEKYGPTVVAEHGPGECDMGASCCDHAHLHLIPLPGLVDPLVDVYREVGGEPRLLSCLGDLHRFSDRPYLFLSPQDDLYMVWTNVERFRRQFVRWATAKLMGIENAYNWRNYSFVHNMLITKAGLTEHLAEFRACA
jgi:diadenosine tetraphosphate (Ap4A) HIT family hydrolase